jgi:hypothetical protein
MGDNVSLTPHGNGQLVSAGEGRGVAALPRGGHCYGSPRRSQHGSSSSSEHSLSGSDNQQNKSKIGGKTFHPGRGGHGHPGQGGRGQHGTRKGESDSPSSSNSVSYPSFSSFSAPKENGDSSVSSLSSSSAIGSNAMVTPTVTKAIRQKFSEAQLAEPGKRKDLLHPLFKSGLYIIQISLHITPLMRIIYNFLKRVPNFNHFPHFPPFFK